MECDGSPVQAIIDTGSQLNIAHKRIWKSVLARPIDMQKVISMSDANGGESMLKGLVTNVPLSCGGVLTHANVYVGEKVPFDLLLGRPWQRGNYVSIDERSDGTYLLFKDKNLDVRHEILVTPDNTVTQIAPEVAEFINKTHYAQPQVAFVTQDDAEDTNQTGRIQEIPNESTPPEDICQEMIVQEPPVKGSDLVLGLIALSILGTIQLVTYVCSTGYIWFNKICKPTSEPQNTQRNLQKNKNQFIKPVKKNATPDIVLPPEAPNIPTRNTHPQVNAPKTVRYWCATGSDCTDSPDEFDCCLAKLESPRSSSPEFEQPIIREGNQYKKRKYNERQHLPAKYGRRARARITRERTCCDESHEFEPCPVQKKREFEQARTQDSPPEMTESNESAPKEDEDVTEPRANARASSQSESEIITLDKIRLTEEAEWDLSQMPGYYPADFPEDKSGQVDERSNQHWVFFNIL